MSGIAGNLDGWVDGWMDGWMDGWTGGWTNKLMYKKLRKVKGEFLISTQITNIYGVSTCGARTELELKEIY